MATSILPPLPAPTDAPADVDSLAARQARNLAQVTDMAARTATAMLTGVRSTYLHAWGVPVPQFDASKKPLPNDPSKRLNENNLSPVDSIASLGTGAQGAFAVHAATLAAVHAIYGDAAMIHPTTGEDMTAAPAGWSVAPQVDGSMVASYTAPAVAQAATVAAAVVPTA